jgi:hypothetical protein
MNLMLNRLEKDILASQLVKSKKVELKPMNSEEAIAAMELSGHDFYVYLDKEHLEQMSSIEEMMAITQLLKHNLYKEAKASFFNKKS